MLVTNQTTQDYWFGPLHLLGGIGQQLTVDDTSSTSLYLSDDVVADAINNLYAAGKITVASAAAPFPRPTGMPHVLHGDGSPEGLVYAPQGSLFQRRDGAGVNSLYVKTTAVTLSTGWVLVGAQAAQLDYAQITANTAAISATSEGTSVAIITGNSVLYDGSQVAIEVFIPSELSSANPVDATYVMYRDSSVLGQIKANSRGTGSGTPRFFKLFDTPAAGSHTYKVSAFVASGSVTIQAGAGGSGSLLPAYLRVSRA
jgi:hypothetical protein